MKKEPLLWYLGFVLIFLLSQDYLFAQWKGAPNFLGLPNWIFWFAFVHFLYIGFFFWFSKKFWR